MTPHYEVLRTWLADGALSGWLPSALQYTFVANSILCALLIGPLLGGIGTMVVVKRMAFFSQAVGQAALTGVAIGILVGEPTRTPYASMFAFCLLFALAMNYARNRTRMSPDVLIGVFLSISLAVGASLLLYVTAKVNIHVLDNILFGSILTVNDTDVTVLLAVSIAVFAIGVPLFNRMLLASFNPSLAAVRGIRVRLLDYAFVVMVTVITVASVKIIGAVLVEALLVIPAASARVLARSLSGFVAWSVLIATIGCLTGILVPMQFDLPVPSGGAIILVCAAFFLAATAVRPLGGRFADAAY
jgi:zinc transport system permease protein